jgi:signal transduction histidine kinase
MEQVFFNLLKNALEAVKDGGSIDIDISSDDNDGITTIRDNGLGMNPEQVTHLFEPYKTSKEHGTGLGLMITARIVRDHGGTIAVESQLGEGTTFTVRLPRIERRIRALKG